VNPRRGRGGGCRIRAYVDTRCVASRRADDDAGVLGNDAAILANDVAITDLHGAHHSLLEVKIQRATHRQFMPNYLQFTYRIACLYVYFTKQYSLSCSNPYPVT